MWHAVSPVEPGYDPILYEGDECGVVSVLNSGPAEVQLRAWTKDASRYDAPGTRVEFRQGQTRLVYRDFESSLSCRLIFVRRNSMEIPRKWLVRISSKF